VHFVRIILRKPQEDLSRARGERSPTALAMPRARSGTDQMGEKGNAHAKDFGEKPKAL